MSIFNDDERQRLAEAAVDEGISQRELWGQPKHRSEYKVVLTPIGMTMVGDWGVTDAGQGYKYEVYHAPSRWFIISDVSQTSAQLIVQRIVARFPALLKGANQSKIASHMKEIGEMAEDVANSPRINHKPRPLG